MHSSNVRMKEIQTFKLVDGKQPYKVLKGQKK